MQGEIGLWTENEVLDQLKNWALSLKKPIPTPTSPFPEGDDGLHVPQTPHAPSTSEKREQAKDRIRTINNLEDAKNILLRLIDLNIGTIIDTILE